MAETDGTVESLTDLLVREQFIQTCTALFLKERMPKSMTEVTKLAEQNIEAHGGSLTSKPHQNKQYAASIIAVMVNSLRVEAQRKTKANSSP